MEPEVRYLILCDEVQTDPNNLLRLDILGLLARLRSTATPPFPFVRPRFTVFVMLSGVQGVGEISVRLVQGDTEKIIYRTKPREVRFAGGLEDSVGLSFHIQDCLFSAPGPYWVEFYFSGQVLGRQKLLVSAS